MSSSWQLLPFSCKDTLVFAYASTCSDQVLSLFFSPAALPSVKRGFEWQWTACFGSRILDVESPLVFFFYHDWRLKYSSQTLLGLVLAIFAQSRSLSMTGWIMFRVGPFSSLWVVLLCICWIYLLSLGSCGVHRRSGGDTSFACISFTTVTIFQGAVDGLWRLADQKKTMGLGCTRVSWIPPLTSPLRSHQLTTASLNNNQIIIMV